MSSLYPLLVPFAPLIAAFFVALPQRNSGSKNYKPSWWILFLGFLTSLFLLWQMIQSPEPIHLVLFHTPWKILPVLELSIDRLSVVMMVVISGFGTLLYRYSTRYLRQDSGQVRYQALLTLAVSSLLFMVSSADLIVLFIFWQMLTWFLCLLSHNFAHLPTAQSSFRTFIMLRLGDLAFLSGITLAYNLYGTVKIAELFERVALDQTHFALFGSALEITGATAITLLIFIAAMSKSAQFPLHMWLPDSLYAPTPIHALLHAGIINAGGFLLARLAPLYVLSPTTLHVVLLIGLVTAILGRSMMLVQNDIKKTLGYSTIGQMGFMIMECGIGAFSLAVFHLVAHGLFKADIFLNCGKVIHEARLHPVQAPQPSSETETRTGWLLALVLSFLMPLAIIIGVHYLFGISFLNSQGLMILFLFSWATASQAMLTLFHIKKTILTKGAMLIGVALVATAYFFAAEQFTHFLIPDSNIVASYFQAAELPQGLFLTLTALIVLSLILSWFFSLYPLRNNEKGSLTRWLKLNTYLFFMNRLYLDGVTLRLSDTVKKLGKKLDRSVLVFILISVFALTIAFRQGGIYSAISVLALIGALWGSIKALIQVRVYRILLYGGIAQYSIILWHLIQSEKITTSAIAYALAVTLTWGALFFAWSRVRARYGDLDLNQIGGLFQPMPRFALCMALLTMAAVGLPPFSLFFAYLGILLSPTTGISPALLVIMVTWFASCWHLFKLMQQLLFGPCRKDLYYEDLNPVEITVLVVVIVLLIISSATPLEELIQWIQ